MYTSRKFFYRARESSVKGVEMNRICVLTYRLDDLQIVDVVSRGVLLRSFLVRGRISRHGLRATVVVGTVYRWKLPIYFPCTHGGHVERKEKNESARRSTIFLDRVRIDRSHIPHFSILWLLWLEFFFLRELRRAQRARTESSRSGVAREARI